MWMMGYNDVGELNVPDSFSGRKLRPLIPGTIPSLGTTSATTGAPTSSLTHCKDFFKQYQYPMSDQSKREFNNITQPVVASSRWNPTPEQLRALEELYRQGTRTPSAEQIQHITSQLRRYGKIEGKNVFYWFQNHKARERQKRRRQMESVAEDLPRDIEILERKDTGSAGGPGYEVEQTKNWAPSLNCSTFSKESVSVQLRAAKATVAECHRVERWIQIDEGELQQSRNFVERNSTWQMMQLPCPIQPNQLINTSTRTTTATVKTTLMDPKFNKTHDLNFLMEPYRDQNYYHHDHLVNSNIVINEEDEITGESAETLQLFPLGSFNRNEKNGGNYKDSNQISVSSMSDTFCPSNYQFFEFLPLKNQLD